MKDTTEPKQTDAALDAFRRALGLNQKEWAKVAEALGLKDYQVWDRVRGKKAITRTDRLAMMAAFLQIPEFDPALGEFSEHDLARVRAAARALRAEIRNLLGERAA